MNYCFKHLKTVTAHRMLVLKFCFEAGLYEQGLLHDLSKFTPTEFSEGVKYWVGNESPNNEARRQLGYSLAWMHHKGRNKHHFEYWMDYGINCPTTIKGIDMPKKYIAELICDRVAASMIYNSDNYDDTYPLKYYLRSEPKLWFVSKKTKRDVRFLLKMVAVKGHTKTFRYIKNVYLKGK